jgi:hypothetical protein
MRACYRTVFLTSLVASVLAVPALAQTQPALTNYPACSTKPSASDSEAAHSAFLLGKRFFDEADYGSAIHNFVDAYKLDCTKTELLTIIARANELSGSRAEAVHALETYLLRVQNLAPEDRAQIQKRIDNLKAQVAAQTPAAAPTPGPVAPVVAPPPPSPTAAEVAPPPPAATEARHHGAAPWVVAGIGGAALVAGGIIWLVGNSQYNAAVSACGGSNTCAPGSPDIAQGNTGHTMMWVGGGVFLGGVGVAGAGLLWHFLEPTGPAQTKATIVPTLGPGYGGLSVAGRF